MDDGLQALALRAAAGRRVLAAVRGQCGASVAGDQGVPRTRDHRVVASAAVEQVDAGAAVDAFDVDGGVAVAPLALRRGAAQVDVDAERAVAVVEDVEAGAAVDPIGAVTGEA